MLQFIMEHLRPPEVSGMDTPTSICKRYVAVHVHIQIQTQSYILPLPHLYIQQVNKFVSASTILTKSIARQHQEHLPPACLHFSATTHAQLTNPPSDPWLLTTLWFASTEPAFANIDPSFWRVHGMYGQNESITFTTRSSPSHSDFLLLTTCKISGSRSEEEDSGGG